MTTLHTPTLNPDHAERCNNAYILNTKIRGRWRGIDPEWFVSEYIRENGLETWTDYEAYRQDIINCGDADDCTLRMIAERHGRTLAQADHDLETILVK